MHLEDAYHDAVTGAVHIEEFTLENLLVAFGEDADDTSASAALVMAVYVVQKSATDRQMKRYTQENGFSGHGDYATIKAIAVKQNLLIKNTAD